MGYKGQQRAWFLQPQLSHLWPCLCQLLCASPGSGHFVTLSGPLPTSALRFIFHAPFCSSFNTPRALQDHLSFLYPHSSLQSNPTRPYPPPRLCF